MQKGWKRWFLRLAAVVGMMPLLLILNTTAFAQEAPPTYKVGVIGFDSFLSREEPDVGGGYAGEYLNLIAEKSGIRFEYVEVPFSDAIRGFRNHEYDLYVGISFDERYAGEFCFSQNDMGKKYVELLVPKEGNTYAFNDYEAFDDLRVGYMSASLNYQAAVDSLRQQNPNIKLVPIDGYSYEEALASGEINAIISSTTKYDSKFLVIGRLDLTSMYFATQKDNQVLMDIIDHAMLEIDVENPLYQNELFDKYYSNVSVSALFTQAELAYIKENPTLNVYFSANRGYLSELRGGTYYGIEEDFTRDAATIAGFELNVVEVPEDSTVLDYMAQGKISVFPGLTYSPQWSEKTQMYTSAPYLTMYHYEISSRNRDGLPVRVAAIPGTALTNEYVLTHFDESNVVYYDNFEQCLRAVKNGSVDATYTTNYVAQYYLKQYEYQSLNLSIVDYTYQLCFGVPANENPILAEILSKCIAKIPQSRVQEIISRDTIYTENGTLLDFVYINPMASILYIVLVMILLFSIVTAFWIIKSRNSQKKALEAALVKAQKANQAKTDFISRISHDMRTPLNGILGLTTLMKETVTEKQARDDLSELEMSGKYLLDLINDNLDIARIENGKFELHPTVVDSKVMFDSIITLCQTSAKRKRLQFNVDVDSNIPYSPLFLDAGRLQEVIMNLVSNAVKFTPDGGTITFAIRNLCVGSNTITEQFVVKDTGPGIKPEFLPHVFDAFAQADSTKDGGAKGTGLGMAICKKIVEQMDGTIQVESVLGKGTTFTVTVKMQLADGEQIREWKNKKAAMVNGYDLEGRHILLCEDHPLNRQIAVRLMQTKGITVETADNGAVGLEKFEHSIPFEYDAVLMDVNMPQMDGLEATRRIRSLERKDAKTVPIIAMTGNAFESDIQKTKAAGMNAHLSKPILPELLYQTLAEAMKFSVEIHKQKILIVDDVEVNRAVIRSTLESEFDVLEAENGAEALEVLAREPRIRIVITDVQMPVMDGVTLLKTIRSNPAFGQLAVIVNTQYGHAEQEEDLLKLGASDFIYKPSSPKLVEIRVKKVLRRL